MVPTPATEDYYAILEVEPNVERQSIVASYRRLALKLHPDRNKNPDATAAFQSLQRAYETLADVSQRREYDLIYATLRKGNCPPKKTAGSNHPSTSTSQSEFLNEAIQIIAHEKRKQERAAQWQISKIAFDATIAKIQHAIQLLTQEIQNLDSIAAAEKALEARKNSWGAWFLSPFYKAAEESEHVKVRKDIERQERRVEKDMKERRLQAKTAELETEVGRCRRMKEQVDVADRDDDEKIRAIRIRRMTREDNERREKERREWAKQQKERQEREAAEKAERERVAELLRKEREKYQKQQQEAAESMRKKQAEQRAARQKQQDHYMPFNSPGTSTDTCGESSCSHDGWWPKVEGRTSCPKCLDVWTYLLQCPSCRTRACPKCQAVMRPRRSRNKASTNSGSYRHRRTPNPTYDFDSFDYFDYD